MYGRIERIKNVKFCVNSDNINYEENDKKKIKMMGKVRQDYDKKYWVISPNNL